MTLRSKNKHPQTSKSTIRQNTKWLSHCIVVFPAMLPFVAKKENEVGRDLWIAYLLLWCIWTSLNIVLTLFLILMVHISPYLTPFLQMIGVHISLKLLSAASSSSGGNISCSAQVGFPNLHLCSSVNLNASGADGVILRNIASNRDED